MSKSICDLNISKLCKYRSTDNKEVGGGTYGSVRIVEKDGKKYAYKILREKDKKSGKSKPTPIYNPLEIDILFRLNSPYLNKGESITEIGECNGFIGIAVEILENSLETALNENSLKYSQKKKIMKDVAMGLKCLHENSIIHLDIKPDNMMYRLDANNNPTGILIDYGLSAYSPDNTPFRTQWPRVTPKYEAPEGHEKNKVKGVTYYGVFSKASDIWSLGISFCEIINNNNSVISSKENTYEGIFKLFNEKNIEKTLDDRVFNLVSMEEKEKKLLKDLIINMLMIKPGERYTIDQVLKHRYWIDSDVKIFNLESCSKEKADDIILDNNIYTLHLLGIYELIEFCKIKLGKYSLEILFLAIDIYLRTISKCNPLENITLLKVSNLAHYCAMEAFKYLYWSEYNDDIYEEIEKIWFSEEIKIFKALDGKINTERYFRFAETMEDLQNIYNGLIYPSEENIGYFEYNDEEYEINRNIMNYLNQDGKEYILSKRKQPFVPIDKYKLKIKDFLV